MGGRPQASANSGETPRDEPYFPRFEPPPCMNEPQPPPPQNWTATAVTSVARMRKARRAAALVAASVRTAPNKARVIDFAREKQLHTEEKKLLTRRRRLAQHQHRHGVSLRPNLQDYGQL